MDAQKITALRQHLTGLIKDPHAVDMCMDLMKIAQIWDDLIDKDKEIDPASVHDVFITALIKLPSNPFYMAFSSELRPLLMNVYLQWRAANEMEQSGKEEDINKAYMLRAGIYQVFAYCAFLVYGVEKSAEISADVWRIYGETLPEFVKEVGGN